MSLILDAALDMIGRGNNLIETDVRETRLRSKETLEIAIGTRVNSLARTDDPRDGLGFELAGSMVQVA